MRNIIPVGDLLEQSWSHFKKFFVENAKIVLIGFIPSIFWAIAQSYKDSLPAGTYGILAFVLVIASICAYVWMTVTLYKSIIKQDGGMIQNDRAWYRYFFPMLWVGILLFFCTFFSFLFFIIPGIWLSVLLGYSQLLMIEDNIRGTHALRASFHLVRGRWWDVFARQMMVSIAFGAAVFALIIVLAIVLALLLAVLPLAAESAVSSIVVTLFSAVITPLFIIAIVKLFHSLKKTT